MVSVKARVPVACLALAMLSGCGGVLQVRDSGLPPKVVEPESAQTVTQRGNPEDTQGAFLPRQKYDAQGKKIPYVAAPNPYTEQSKPVPPEARAAFADGVALLKSGNLRMARKGFRAMTKTFPELSGPWVKLAEIAERREKPEKAREAYQKALEVNPANVNAYLKQAVFERRQGEFARARDVYLAALKTWKDFPEAHLNLAILYDLYMNRPEDAQPHYEAYDFLTGGQDPKVADWLIEIRRRTGIETSFIDKPPSSPKAGPEKAAQGKSASADAGKGESMKNEEQG